MSRYRKRSESKLSFVWLIVLLLISTNFFGVEPFADLVITISFHGVVFSIIFHKKFIYIPLKGTHAASNNRVLDLLNRLGLSQRILKDNTVLPEIFDNQIDYVSVDEKLSLQKAASIQYLVNALNLETE